MLPQGLPKLVSGDINNKLCHYADDTSLIISGSSFEEINKQLQIIFKQNEFS